MPSLAPNPAFPIHTYRHPDAFPAALWLLFRRHERVANVVYPHALAARNAPQGSHNSNAWLTLHDPNSLAIDLVLSVTEWTMGNYPVFIFSSLPASSLTFHFLAPRIHALAQRLLQVVPERRVYSIFAPAPIAKAFSRVWQALTAASPIKEPYYAAAFTFCTSESFLHSSRPDDHRSFSLRRAQESDIPHAAALCEGFASTSSPFILDPAGALKEATYLWRNGMLWVHEVEDAGLRGIASIVATSRQSESVTAITKVFTNPEYRSRGCAERLVRFVTHHVLFVEKKHSVVLFVAHTNPAAAKVYDRVGFIGLCGKPRVDGVDPWLEIGFHDTDLGHW